MLNCSSAIQKPFLPSWRNDKNFFPHLPSLQKVLQVFFPPKSAPSFFEKNSFVCSRKFCRRCEKKTVLTTKNRSQKINRIFSFPPCKLQSRIKWMGIGQKKYFLQKKERHESSAVKIRSRTEKAVATKKLSGGVEVQIAV